MIDELEILKTILENLSTVGIQGVFAYIAYKVLIASFWLAGCIYTVKAWFALFIRLKEMNVVRAEDESYLMQRLRDELESCRRERDEARRSAEEVKHMYKLLKEKPNV